MAKVLAYSFDGIEFKLPLHHYVQLRINTLGKGIEPPFPPQLLVNSYHYCSSTRMALALNNTVVVQPPISQTIPERRARHAWHCW